MTFDRFKHTVLVVDPSANNRTQLCECLSQLPEIQAIAAGDGAQAMRLFRERPPSLVLLDISLHDTDSLTLARDMMVNTTDYPSITAVADAARRVRAEVKSY